MLKFNIPGTYDHHGLNMFLLQHMVDEPELFREDIKISSVFGNFPYCIWDGGRNFPRVHQCTKEEIRYIKQTYDMYNIPLRLVFTNPVIEEEHLYDRYCNLVLKELDNNNNEIVVNSPLLEEYLRSEYPGYKIISSTTKRLGKKEFLTELSKEDYYQVCLDYDLNHDQELLDSIPMKERSKVEILSNAICPAHCAFRKQHYDCTGHSQLTFARDGYTVNGVCGIKTTLNHPSALGKGNNLSIEEMREYSKKGFNTFKLEGRTLSSTAMFANYLYYFAKPEAIFYLIEKAGCLEGIYVNDKNGPLCGDLYEPERINLDKNIVYH